MYLWNLHPIKAVVFDAFGTVIDYPVKLSPYALLRRHWRSEQGFKQACLTQNIALPDLLQQLQLETLFFDGSDQTFYHSILLWAMRCDEFLLQSIASHQRSVFVAGKYQTIIRAQ